MFETVPLRGAQHVPQGFEIEPGHWNIHASAVCLNGHVVMVTGPAKSGKTSLCDIIVRRCEGAVWLADDRVEICSTERGFRLAAPNALAGQMQGEAGLLETVAFRSDIVVLPQRLIWLELSGRHPTASAAFAGQAIHLKALPPRPAWAIVEPILSDANLAVA